MTRTKAAAPADALLETREGDATAAAPITETCVVLRLGNDSRLIDVKDHAEVIVGRAKDATVSVDDDRISRRHLRIVCRESTLYAMDLGSKNGTTLNGRKLDSERVLYPGDELVAGPAHLTVSGIRRPRSVLGEGEIFERLSAEVERATRYRRPLTVVCLALDGSATACLEATRRVASRLRRIDLIGEYLPGRFLILLPETGTEPGAGLAEGFAAMAREMGGVAASARAAFVPENGSAPDALIAAALDGVGPTARANPEAPVLVTEDPSTIALFETARKAARSNATVLIVGETGSGKEWVASEIHRGSPRVAGPYVKLNCAAFPETLLESELFGHEKGAFTGADRRRVGRIESARGGTIFLDELGEMPASMQAKLLRVLEDHVITRLGGNEEVKVDVRFIAATHRDLEREVAQGRFRQDLYFRLATITLKVPPLRERPRDLLALAELFTSSAAASSSKLHVRLHARFLAALRRYPWPGNVRELKNVIERAVILAETGELGPEQLPERFGAVTELPEAPTGGPMKSKMDGVERASLEKALQESEGNRTHAAKRLGISRRALIYKLKKHGLS